MREEERERKREHTFHSRKLFCGIDIERSRVDGLAVANMVSRQR